MVGNNTREDLAAMQLGLDGYLVTDWLLNPDGFDIETVKHGSLADFLKFAEALPACKAGAESGAASAESGAVASAETGASSETAAETGTGRGCPAGKAAGGAVALPDWEGDLCAAGKVACKILQGFPAKLHFCLAFALF